MGQQHQSSGGPSAGGGMYLLSLFGIGGIGVDDQGSHIY